MVRGVKIDRIHHLLSDLEYFYFLICEFLCDVIDIREQFALVPWDVPQEIARELVVPYPRYPGTRIPYVMTSDLVLTVLLRSGARRTVVWCIKYAAELNPKHRNYERTTGKLLIEREYWLRLGAEWYLRTEQNLPMIRVANLDFTRPAMVSRELDHLNPLIPDFVQVFVKRWVLEQSASLNSLLRHAARTLEVPMSHSLALFGRATWTRMLPLNFDVALLHHECPVQLVL